MIYGMHYFFAATLLAGFLYDLRPCYGAAIGFLLAQGVLHICSFYKEYNKKLKDLEEVSEEINMRRKRMEILVSWLEDIRSRMPEEQASPQESESVK